MLSLLGPGVRLCEDRNRPPLMRIAGLGNQGAGLDRQNCSRSQPQTEKTTNDGDLVRPGEVEQSSCSSWAARPAFDLGTPSRTPPPKSVAISVLSPRRSPACRSRSCYQEPLMALTDSASYEPSRRATTPTPPQGGPRSDFDFETRFRPAGSRPRSGRGRDGARGRRGPVAVRSGGGRGGLCGRPRLRRRGRCVRCSASGRAAHGVAADAGVGLVPGGPGRLVVQHDHQERAPGHDRVAQGRDGGVEERGVAEKGDDPVGSRPGSGRGRRRSPSRSRTSRQPVGDGRQAARVADQERRGTRGPGDLVDRVEDLIVTAPAQKLSRAGRSDASSSARYIPASLRSGCQARRASRICQRNSSPSGRRCRLPFPGCGSRGRGCARSPGSPVPGRARSPRRPGPPDNSEPSADRQRRKRVEQTDPARIGVPSGGRRPLVELPGGEPGCDHAEVARSRKLE